MRELTILPEQAEHMAICLKNDAAWVTGREGPAIDLLDEMVRRGLAEEVEAPIALLAAFKFTDRLRDLLREMVAA